MNKQTSNATKTLRFRRWSRARYAVFASLSYAVTIGVLNSTISEKSLRKSAISHRTGSCSTFDLFGEDEIFESSLTPLSLDELPLVNAQLNFTINQTLDNAAACDLIFYKPLSTVEAGNSCFNRFLF